MIPCVDIRTSFYQDLHDFDIGSKKKGRLTVFVLSIDIRPSRYQDFCKF